MRKIATIVMMIAVLVIPVMSHAYMVWCDGYVRDQDGVAVVGATVKYPQCGGGYKYMTTASDGSYGFLRGCNWCNNVMATVSKTGHTTRSYWVFDESCCNCTNPDCSEEQMIQSCESHITYNFTLPFVDTDNDGVYNANDNCPYKANGPDLGTCSAGNLGISCTHPSHCNLGCAVGYCSMNQEDADGDGIGDVCEGAFMDASEGADVSYEDEPEEDEVFMPARASNINIGPGGWIGLFLAWYCKAQGGCDYGCLGQAFEDFMNGPDVFLGKWIYPEGKRPLMYECPEGNAFWDWIFMIRDILFNIIIHGDPFPPELE